MIRGDAGPLQQIPEIAKFTDCACHSLSGLAAKLRTQNQEYEYKHGETCDRAAHSVLQWNREFEPDVLLTRGHIENHEAEPIRTDCDGATSGERAPVRIETLLQEHG